MRNEVNLIDAIHPVDTDGMDPIKHPIEPPEFELFAQRITSNAGLGKGYILKSYKEAGLDPMIHAMFKEWKDVPCVVKRRVKYLLSQTASNTVADRREIEEFLTAVMRNDERMQQRSDGKHLNAIDAVKELCKMRGFYSPVEIKNTHEIVVPDVIQKMSDEELSALVNQAKTEVIDVEFEVSQQNQLEMKGGD